VDGTGTLTLADLLRPRLRAVVVGINPSPVSVAAGRYYQSQPGQRFFQRLDEAGVINLSAARFEDDASYAAGIGFTDVVKRPTHRATGLHPGELEHGRELLDRKLSRLKVPKLLFTFKGSAEALLGPRARPGLQTRTISGAEVFAIPGPMAAGAITERVHGRSSCPLVDTLNPKAIILAGWLGSDLHDHLRRCHAPCRRSTTTSAGVRVTQLTPCRPRPGARQAAWGSYAAAS
jgi:TDG/mug DNA glycosylase family protein